MNLYKFGIQLLYNTTTCARKNFLYIILAVDTDRSAVLKYHTESVCKGGLLSAVPRRWRIIKMDLYAEEGEE